MKASSPDCHRSRAACKGTAPGCLTPDWAEKASTVGVCSVWSWRGAGWRLATSGERWAQKGGPQSCIISLISQLRATYPEPSARCSLATQRAPASLVLVQVHHNMVVPLEWCGCDVWIVKQQPLCAGLTRCGVCLRTSGSAYPTRCGTSTTLSSTCSTLGHRIWVGLSSLPSQHVLQLLSVPLDSAGGVNRCSALESYLGRAPAQPVLSKASSYPHHCH